MKAKSSEGLVCYVIRILAFEVQDKCLPILTQVKTLLVREYAGICILDRTDHNIIQLFDGNNTVQRNWRQLHNRNNPPKEFFATTEIEEPCKPISLLYTLGF